jgi:hypothetical protein
MLRALMLFAAGWYFGRTPSAGRQFVAAGRQLLDAASGEPVAENVLPETRIISPEQANACPPGYTWWPQYGQCLDPTADTRLRQQWIASQGQTR